MAYKKQLRDKDGNVVYPDVGINLDDAVYSDDPGESIDDIIDPNNYSTEEKWTGGYWIDGKKIYRRGFSGTYSVSGGSVWDTAIMNGVVDTIISWGGSMEYGGGINAIPFGEGSGNYCILFKRDSSGDVILRRYSSDTRTNCKYSLWVEYTKPS